jgi:oxygen-dependent protoporphyrinogen oxidase
MRVLPRSEGGETLLSVVYLNDAAREGGLLLLDARPSAASAVGDDADLAARLESELGDVHPDAAALVTDRRTLRWHVFVPSYPVGRARELAEFRASQPAGPVQLAGDYLCGPLMEGAVRAGEDAADRVTRHLARTPA